MNNEALFIIIALLDLALVFFTARRTPQLLYGVIILNLVLVSIFGSKVIELFGFTTNGGNIFYASTFIAAYFLIEQQGKEAGLKSILYGAGGVFCFIVLSNLTSFFTSPDLTTDISTVVQFPLRVAIASILAYVFAQYWNVIMYEWIKIKTNGRKLWLRVLVSNTTNQLFDSMLFFSIVFYDAPAQLLIQTILVGWLAKSFVGVLAVPFLYLNESLVYKKS